MGLYGSDTPKCHVGYSNCSVIGRLNLGRMTKAQMKALKKKTSSTKSYINSQGMRCWTRTKYLKRTQRHSCSSLHCRGSFYVVLTFGMSQDCFVKLRHYPPKFGIKMRKMFKDLMETRHNLPEVPLDYCSDPLSLFGSLEWSNLCRDSDMTSEVGIEGVALNPNRQ